MFNNFDKIMQNMDYAFNYNYDNFNIDFERIEKLAFIKYINNKIDIIKNIEKINYIELTLYFKDLETIKNIELYNINDFYKLFESIKNKDFDKYANI